MEQSGIISRINPELIAIAAAFGASAVILAGMVIVNAEHKPTIVDCKVNNDITLGNSKLTVAQNESDVAAIPKINGDYAVFMHIGSGVCNLVHGDPLSK